MDDQERERFLEEAVKWAIANYVNLLWRAASKSKDAIFDRWRVAQAAIPNCYYLRGVLVNRHGLEAMCALIRVSRDAFEDLVWDLIHEDLLLRDEQVAEVAKAVLVVRSRDAAWRQGEAKAT